MKRQTRLPADVCWLRDCGWTGWKYDEARKKVVTDHGEAYTPERLHKLLMALPGWPRPMIVPKLAKKK